MGWSLLHPIAMTAVLCIVFSQLLSQDIRTLCPVSFDGLDLLGVHLGDGDGWLPVLPPGRILHSTAARPIGDLSFTKHAGSGLPLFPGICHRLGVRLVDARVRRPRRQGRAIEMKGLVEGFNYGQKGSIESLLVNCDGKIVQANFPSSAAVAVTQSSGRRRSESARSASPRSRRATTRFTSFPSLPSTGKS